tara:strand:+ start:191 stop:1342 length:1152 start_codon:yes stop_codon:yes gene_type:complete
MRFQSINQAIHNKEKFDKIVVGALDSYWNLLDYSKKVVVDSKQSEGYSVIASMRKASLTTTLRTLEKINIKSKFVGDDIGDYIDIIPWQRYLLESRRYEKFRPSHEDWIKFMQTIDIHMSWVSGIDYDPVEYIPYDVEWENWDWKCGFENTKLEKDYLLMFIFYMHYRFFRLYTNEGWDIQIRKYLERGECKTSTPYIYDYKMRHTYDLKSQKHIPQIINNNLIKSEFLNIDKEKYQKNINPGAWYMQNILYEFYDIDMTISQIENFWFNDAKDDVNPIFKKIDSYNLSLCNVHDSPVPEPLKSYYYEGFSLSDDYSEKGFSNYVIKSSDVIAYDDHLLFDPSSNGSQKNYLFPYGKENLGCFFSIFNINELISDVFFSNKNY